VAWQALVCTAGLALALPAMARADSARFDIPAEAMPAALKAFAAQAHMQLLYQYNAVKNAHGNAVNGDLDKRAALEQLLRNSGLEVVYSSDSAATIRPISKTTANLKSDNNSQQPDIESNRSSRDRPHLAQADQGTPAGGSTVKNTEQTPQSKAGPLEEVIVSARKRDERLQDVPVPVSVISANSLVNSQEVLFRDYYSSVPGLSMTTTTQSSQILSIRGIVSNPGNPTVGITVDDVPFGSSTIGGGGLVVPDLDPGDLSQIEVLRGPQGTLYGASSLGGLIKFVTVTPSTDRVSGNLQAGVSSVRNGDEAGYVYRGALNAPLSDTWAVRASGFMRLDPGYITNPLLNIKGLNTARAEGGLVSTLWQLAQNFSVKLSALLQKVSGDGSSDVDIGPGLGDLQQNYIRGVGGYERRVQAYSGTLKARLGSVDLISISGYNVNKFSDSWDYTFGLGPYTQMQFGVPGSPIFTHNTTKKFTQEIRFSSSIGQKFDWSVGAFYTHEHSDYVQDLPAEDPATGAIVGSWCDCSSPSTYTESALFPALTYHVTDRFDIQLGARESRIRQTFLPEVFVGPYTSFFLNLPSPVTVPAAYASGSPFTYLVTPRYRLSSDLMVYLRLASGYRAGGSNQGIPGVPPEYGPDKTQNYELGAKGDFLDHKLSFDASIYYIAWKDIQLSFIDPQNFMAYNGNGGRAKSQGVELSIKVAPLQGLAIAAWVAYNQAELTEDFPAAVVAAGEFGLAGDRLPFSNRYSGYVSVDQKFPLGAAWSGFVGGDLSYVGDRVGFFAPTSQRTLFPAYGKADLRAGVTYNSWTATFFANNVADKRAPIAGGLGYFPPSAFEYIQPRTVGLNVSKGF
jgi:outer membrane receptor protein involved in Fe transport